MKKQATILFITLISIGCKSKSGKIGHDDSKIDSLIHQSDLAIERSKKIQHFTDSTSTIEIVKMQKKISKISCELEELKKTSELQPAPMRMFLKRREISDTIVVERSMSFEEVERLYFEMKVQRDSQRSELDSGQHQNNQNQNKQLKNEKLPERPFQ